jgi:hypothetical protein
VYWNVLGAIPNELPTFYIEFYKRTTSGTFSNSSMTWIDIHENGLSSKSFVTGDGSIPDNYTAIEYNIQ